MMATRLFFQSASRIDDVVQTFCELSGWRRVIALIAVGAASALSMAPIYLTPLLGVGFTLLILCVARVGNDARPRLNAFIAGWLFGYGYFLVSVYWMALSFFVQADQFAWMAPFAILGLPAGLAIFPGIACLIAAQFKRTGAGRLLIFVAAYAFVEYLRGHILTGLPWNMPGQALAGTAMGAQTVAYYGAYGLNITVLLLAGLPALFYRRGGVLMGFVVSAIAFFALMLIGAARLMASEPANADTIHVRIVQPNIPQREKIDPSNWARNFQKQLLLSKGDAPGDLVILWPENASPLLDESPDALRAFAESLPRGSVLITGSVRRTPIGAPREEFYNSVLVIGDGPEGWQVLSSYDKHHLVPFGEYLPLYSALKTLGLAQLTPFGEGGFTPGSGPATRNAHGASFAPLICYEAIFPGALYPKNERPQWLAAVTNDAWFGDTSGPRQHLDQARLRTIESGLPMARSANTGISTLIDAKGRIIERLPLYTSGRIDAVLPGSLQPTIYDRMGDTTFTIYFAIVVLSGGIRYRFARRL